MQTIAYGPAPDQAGELYLPSVPRAPLVCLFHGGFWRMPYGRDQLHPMALDLQSAGLAVWNLGYRRVGAGGTPWPATLEDAESLLAHLPALQRAHPLLDLGRLAFAGHSAGGQLAFWTACQARRVTPALRPAAIGLAPMLDLEAAAATNLGNGAIPYFLGGRPADLPERYRITSPIAMLPLGVRQWILHGAADRDIPASYSEGYVARARAAGDDVTYLAVDGADHMSLIDPASTGYREVRRVILSVALAEIVVPGGGRASPG